jgi:HEAT repeat protein
MSRRTLALAGCGCWLLVLAGCGDPAGAPATQDAATADKPLTDAEAQTKLRSLKKKTPRKNLDAASPIADLTEAVLNASDPGQQIRAAQLLGERGPAAAEAVPALSQAARAHFVQVRTAAGEALRKIQPDLGVDPVLIAGLDNYDGGDLDAALAGLAEAGEPATPALIAALKSPTPRVRRNAGIALGRIGPAARAAVPDLAALLADSDNSVREGAAQGLGGIGPDAAAASAPLVQALKAHPGSRAAVGRALGKLGEAAVPELARALREPDADVRAYVGAAMRTIGDPAIPALTEALTDPDVGVREASVYALGVMGPRATEAVISALTDNDPAIRIVAATSLGEAPPESVEAARAALQAAAADQDERVRTAITAALARLGPAE